MGNWEWGEVLRVIEWVEWIEWLSVKWEWWDYWIEENWLWRKYWRMSDKSWEWGVGVESNLTSVSCELFYFLQLTDTFQKSQKFKQNVSIFTQGEPAYNITKSQIHSLIYTASWIFHIQGPLIWKLAWTLCRRSAGLYNHDLISVSRYFRHSLVAVHCNFPLVARIPHPCLYKSCTICAFSLSSPEHIPIFLSPPSGTISCSPLPCVEGSTGYLTYFQRQVDRSQI